MAEVVYINGHTTRTGISCPHSSVVAASGAVMRVRFFCWDWCDATADLFRFGVTRTFWSVPWKQPRTTELVESQQPRRDSKNSRNPAQEAFALVWALTHVHVHTRNYQFTRHIHTCICSVDVGCLFFKFTIFLILFSQIPLHSHTCSIQLSHMWRHSPILNTFFMTEHHYSFKKKSELMIRRGRMRTLRMVWGSELQRLLFTQA